MEFTVKKQDLQRELELAQGVVERKSTIPILSNLLFEAKGDGLEIAATDLELGIKTGCRAKVKTEGGGTVPARRLYEIVRLLPDAEIRFKLLENHWLELRCQGSHYKLVGMAKDNFPALPAQPHPLVRIPALQLSTTIGKTTFAISLEESRYTLNGALMILKPDSLTMVATDGHRLAYVEAACKFDKLGAEVRVLVPKKALAELDRLLKEVGDPAKTGVEFARDDSHLFFSVGADGSERRRLLIARMLTGQFPNYEAVLPRENNRVVVLDRDAARAAIGRAALQADQRSHAVRVALDKEKVEISASSSEYGEAREELALPKAFGGDPLAIGFNAAYLLDFLGAAAAGPVSFEFKDEQSAGQLRPLAEEDLTYRYVIMPMRL
ncbi:MAG: DNA polymerase III subunit beta [Acidobacteria bacterium]|nr:DNA polymerase III subunit beta [Acidobacteriota bacterium]